MATGTLSAGCDLMRRAILSMRQEIQRKEARLRVLKSRLATLQSQPNPNAAALSELKADMDELEKQLVEDRGQLNAFEEEFSASCGPPP